MKAFMESQLGHCPLVWMFHSRSLNNKINQMHERASIITYNDKSSSFRKSFRGLNNKINRMHERASRITLNTPHHRNIKVLATGTYKSLQGLSSPLINEIFVERSNHYSLRGNNVLTTRRLNSVRYGTETVSLLDLEIWDTLPKEF